MGSIADTSIQQGKAVTVSLEDLKSGISMKPLYFMSTVRWRHNTDFLLLGSVPFSTLEEAFGPESLGIIVVKGLPEKFEKLRTEALANSSYLAGLGKEKLGMIWHLFASSRSPNCSSPSVADAVNLASLESPESKYLVGWSHGKETLRPGVVDIYKGSYYINCAFYQEGHTVPFDPNFPEYTSANIWPSKETLPTFQSSLEELITLIIDVAILVARACDRYAMETISNYKPGYLEHVVKSSLTSKARLLHYFPEETEIDPPEPSYDDNWCATHKDHGCLTGLTSAMFVDETSASRQLPSFSPSNPVVELPRSPDPTSGLYIHSRSGTTTKIGIPRDCLAFQTGETLEVITKGMFRAVPHFVKGAKGGRGTRIARNTLAVFTQPNLEETVDLDSGLTFGEFARGIVKKNTTS
ncbi:hypothetical protein UCRPC4_g03103 [Phaeomoniella chlamydospora]|uniref:Clavaminate synthase-like protein n=1 Tax=Phaeomoniella chlamydospora TaxID=158046 RepID=A0A0G2EIV9_PHACM|nr:hypothetical protein UCRPC4_g03103 [Phaeomoniella chlamydospora]